MKRNVQILLIFACLVPVFAGAREETMEERKRRITRKYLRERVDVTYSEMVVPDADAEDEDVLASEKFKQPQVDLQRQEPGAPILPPVQRPVSPAENRNWLLSEDSEMDDPYADPFSREDPYADPFALKDSKDDSKKKSDWALGTEGDSSPYAGAQRESRFNWRNYGPSQGQQSGSYDPTRQGIFNPRDPRASFAEGMQPGFQQQEGQIPGSIGEMDLSRGKTFNSIFNRERSQSPFVRETESPVARSFGSDAQQQQRKGGYTPYRSPYQTQREQRQQPQRGGYSEPKQEYQRKDTFQQWKDRNPTPFDPTSDDAFVNEMMPKIRR